MRIAQLCSVIAETLGPENENVDCEILKYWVDTKKDSIYSLREMFKDVDFAARMKTWAIT